MFGFQNRDDFKRRGSFKRQKLSGRADAILAPAAEMTVGMTIQSRNFNQHAVFCSLAASRSTCCIRISSSKQKSRATLILFRGRVLSCVYGKRGIDHYKFGRAAFANAQIDLLQQQAEFSVHSLSEETALSAAAFFEGHQQDQPKSAPIQDFFAKSSDQINSRKAPGCFVVRDNAKNASSVVYFFGGKIIGIFSYEKGWLKDNRFETAVKTVSEKKGFTTAAYLLSAWSMQEIYDLTFSLTGVDDTEIDREDWINSAAANNEVTSLLSYSKKPSGLRDTFMHDPGSHYQSALDVVHGYALRQSRQHGHSIDPGRDKAS
jgi:hypothetical protein